MNSIVTTLNSLAGHYEGEGANHDGQSFMGRLWLRPAVHGQGLSLHFSATGRDGMLYHEEQSLIALNLNEKLCLWNLNTNMPGLVEHNYIRQEPRDGGLSHVFGFGNPQDRTSFREEISLDLWDNGEISYRYFWGMPGGDFMARSQVRMKQKDFTGVNHIIVMVTDMSKSIEFYEMVLGLKSKLRSDFWTEFQVGDLTLALHGGGQPRDQRQPGAHSSAAGTASISFDVEDVEKVHSDLVARGMIFTLAPTIRQNEGIKLAVGQDPDGFEICFAQRL